MKKILMGLTALSTLSFAVIDLGTAQPTPDTNVFQTGQTGKIVVEGAVTSTVPVIKYVVYSSADGTYDANGDKWVLPDIIVSQEEATSTLSATPKKVYVKRVNGTNDDVEPLVTEKVTFTVNRDPYYTGWYPQSTGRNGSITVGQSLICQPTGLLAKSTLEEIIKTSGLNCNINANGDIYESYPYITYKAVKFIQSINGELEFQYISNPVWGNSAMDPTKINTAFATKRMISNVTVSVTIN